MTILKQELRRGKWMLLIWTGAIAFMIFICLMIFPEMKQEMVSVSDIFSSMGGFTAAFGMDKLSFGELMGFYGVECGNIVGLGGAFYAAFIGISALAGEEKNHTAEFLLTHPISRGRIVLEKLLAVLVQLLILNIITPAVSLLSFRLIGEEPSLKEFFLLHGAYLLLQINISSVCFGISAFIRRGSIGIGLGLAAMMYFCNLIANISEQAELLKYITPFAYADASDIISEAALDGTLVIPGCIYTAIGIAAAFRHYTQKDIAA